MARSIRNFLATHNLLAVSANYQEVAINCEQALDTTFLVDLNTVLNYRALKVTNREELTGKEEADCVYDLGGLVAGNLSFSRAQPQHFAFLLSYALGEVSTEPAGSRGFRHTIRPRQGEVDWARSNPSFTAAMRFGKQVLTRRFASCFVDQVRVEFAKDGWAKITGVIKGTGKVTDNAQVEEITAPANSERLVLAANGVEGEEAAERLANVQAVQVFNPAIAAWEEVAYHAVTASEPAEISISPPGQSQEPVKFRVYYLPKGCPWSLFPPRVEEPPLKVQQLSVWLGGRWTGEQFVGGSPMKAELRRVVWNFKNHLTPERYPGGDGAANRAFRTGREQKLTFDRDFRDVLVARLLADNDCFGLYLKAVGPEFEPGYPYQVEMVFPRVAVLAAPIRVAQRRLAEEVEFAVLEDDTYGSVIVRVQNLVSSYAA